MPKSDPAGGLPLLVLVVSDGTGRTAQQLVEAALTQFENAPVEIVRHTDIRTPEQVRTVVQQAASRPSVVLYTLVSEDLRRLVVAEAHLAGVDAVDALGPLLERFAAKLKRRPQQTPGLFRQLADSRSREIAAVAFAFAHDDGQRAEDLPRAEVVVVGVSRSMKTPTMLYLAYRGWFAANVPLIPGIPPPPTLVQLPPERVFCLFTSPARLRSLRRARARQERIPQEPYTSPEQISRELEYAARMCDGHGWRRINVTGKSVEEVCREIIALLPEPADRHK